MIVDEKVGYITEAEEPTILFDTNHEGLNDAGLARQMFEKYPNLKRKFPMGQEIGYGPHLVKSKGKNIIAFCCHSLTGDWDHETTAEAICRLQLFDGLGRIAIPEIGTGFLGKTLGADWSRIRRMLEKSPLEFVLYSLHPRKWHVR